MSPPTGRSSEPTGGPFVGTIATHSRAVLAAAVIITLVVGSGVTAVETDPSIDRFEADSPEADALAYADENFGDADAGATDTYLLLEDQEALSRETTLATLELQAELREHDDVGPTLAAENPTVGLGNVLATAVIREERVETLEARAKELDARAENATETGERIEAELERIGRYQWEYERLNESRSELGDAEYDRRAATKEAAIDRAVANATAGLDEAGADRFGTAAGEIRAITAEMAAAERAGDDAELSRLEERRNRTVVTAVGGILGPEYEAIRAEGERLEAEADAVTAAQPPIDEQIDAIEALSEEEYEAALEELLSGTDPAAGAALEFLPADHEPGETSADSRAIVLAHSTDGIEIDDAGTATDRITAAQLSVRELTDDRDREYAVAGVGLVVTEIDRSITDTLTLVGPLALAFVLVTLALAYRDPLDVLLGIAGTLLVLVWTVGAMGWAGITLSQPLVAVPVLLVGLSIDYALHVIMRYRERYADGAVRTSMWVALAGVGVALGWVTATTAAGFLANLASPIEPIGEFGLASAAGILAAFVVFGAVVPAATIELDEALEARGIDRRRRAFGTDGGYAGRLLSAVARTACRRPAAILLCVLVVTGGAAAGATAVETSFNEEGFLPESVGWTDRLPDAVAPGEYRVGEDLSTIDATHERGDDSVQLLVRGEVTDGEFLERLADVEAAAAEAETVHAPGGEVDAHGPLSTVEEVAAEDPSTNATVALADRTGDGVPNQNVGGVYDRLFAHDPDAAGDVIHRIDSGERSVADGTAVDHEYAAVRLVLPVRAGADPAEVAADSRELAAILEGEDRTVVATGEPIVDHVVEERLLGAVIRGLAATLVVVVGLLAVGFRRAGYGASLGLVTVVPVAAAVCWLLGAMALADVPLNVLTGTVASLAVGLGVAYSIHVSARYAAELEGSDVRTALERTLTATGGALSASSATTVGGFGVLALATLPVLRQFGLLTALSILAALLASVVVLPPLLVVWSRWLGPDGSTEASPDGSASPSRR